MHTQLSQSPRDQLELFAGLAVPAPIPRIKWARRIKPAAQYPVQLAIEFRNRPAPCRTLDVICEVLQEILDDLGDEKESITHRTIKAEDCQAIKTTAAASIWAMASSKAAEQVIAGLMLAPEQPPQHTEPQIDRIHRRIIRESGVTRHLSMRLQETDEWAEKERARRARQKLPKPPKQTFRLKRELA